MEKNGILFFVSFYMYFTAFLLICEIIIYVYRLKVNRKEFFLGLLLITCLNILPHFLIIFKGLHPLLKLVLTVPSPGFVYIYYLIFYFILGIPSTHTQIFLPFIIAWTYLTTLLNIAFSDLGHRILITLTKMQANTLALIITMLISFLIVGVFKIISGKYKYNMVISRDHFKENANRILSKIFLNTSLSYLLLQIMLMLLFNRLFEHTVLRLMMYMAMAFIIIIFMTNAFRGMRINLYEMQIQEYAMYVNSLQLVNEQLNSVKHDLNNILQTYDGYLSVSDWEGMRKYHQSFKKAAAAAGRNFEIIESLRNRMAVFSLISLKNELAVEKNVTLTISNIGGIADAVMDDFDLCRILGNLLDNAIEAAAESDEKYIDLYANYSNEHYLTVMLCNSIKEYVDIEDIAHAGNTSKKGHQGMGLVAARAIIASYKKSYIHFQCENNRFCAFIGFELL